MQNWSELNLVGYELNRKIWDLAQPEACQHDSINKRIKPILRYPVPLFLCECDSSVKLIIK